MKFDLLNQSIELNAEESPSIFNALCMIRSLFRDVKDAAGESDLSRCPVGDEKLPLEMVWLSKELLKIYEDNDESLRRNRARLDSIMEKLRTAQQELETYADAERLLPQKEAEYQALENRLAAAKLTKAAYDQTLSRIEAAQAQLALLQQFDAGAAAQTLADLEDQVRTLGAEKTRLETDLAARRKEAADLTAGNAALRQEDTQKLQPELTRLTNEKTALTEKKQNTQTQITQLTTETEALARELETVTASLSERTRERDAAQTRVDDYRRDVLNPVVTQRDELLTQEQKLLTEKSDAEQKIQELQTAQCNLILEISRKKNQYDIDSKKHGKILADAQALDREQDELDRQLVDAANALERKQKAVAHLKNVRLPEASTLLEAEARRAEDLQTQIDGIHGEHTRKTALIQKMELELPDLNEKLSALRATYAALTATYNASCSEIDGLERRIRELEEKNDTERLARFRRQREERLEELTGLAGQCEQLRGEVHDLEEQVKTQASVRQNLTELKKRQEEGLAGIALLLKELEPYTRAETLEQAKRTAAQYQRLSSIRGGLANAIRDAQRHILPAKSVCADDLETLEDLKGYLDDAVNYSVILYKTLLESANALADHMREESK